MLFRSLGVEADPVIWTARLRTDHEAIFRVSVSRVFKAGAATASAAEEVSGVTGSAAVGALVGIALGGVEDSVAVALADSAAAEGADGNN